MPTPSSRLRFEPLEERSLLSAATFGGLWPDASALSLSFAPDATAIGDRKSELFKVLDKTGGDDDWQREVLRAFQAWAAHSNINIAVTKDGGDAFGTPGDTQGDTRFGDIRIGATALADDSLAIVSPFDWSIGTWSGDVLLNSSSKFAIQSKARNGAYDLFTVLLHEAGHVFGIDHSVAPGSAIAARYAGAVTGPTEGDIAALQAVYGPRSSDSYEGETGNDSAATATHLTGDSNLYAVADVGSRSDQDHFTFTVPSGADKFSIRVRTAGLSSLVPSLTVFDSNGNVVGSKYGKDPLDPKDLEIKASGKPGSRFTVRVNGATNNEFAIGRYEISVNYRKEAEPGGSGFVRDGGADDTIVTAADFLPGGQADWRASQNRYAQNGAIESATDTDYYRLTAPAIGSGTADALTVKVRAISSKAGTLIPVVSVFDAAGRPLSAQVLDSDGPSITIQIPGISRGATYFIRVANANRTTAGTGNYRLTAAFGEIAESGMKVVQAGMFESATRAQTSELNVVNGRLFQFALTATGASGDRIRLSIVNDRGREVFAVSQDVNVRPESGQIYLPTGRYRLLISQIRGTETARYWLQAGVYSDPIGPYAPRVVVAPTETAPPPVLSPFTSDAQLFSDNIGYWYVPFTAMDPRGYYYEM
jgi:Matrixin